MTKKENAVDTFLNGHRCSQAVLGAFSDDFNLDRDTAHTISLALAGGAGIGSFCGGLSGGFLVLAMKYGFPGPGNPEQMKILMEKNRELCKRFKKNHGQVNCPDLLGFDIFSEAGMEEFTSKNLKETYCANLVSDTVEILEKIMK